VVPEVNTNTAIIQTVSTVLHLSHIFLTYTYIFFTAQYIHPLQLLSSASFYFAMLFHPAPLSNSCTSTLLICMHILGGPLTVLAILCIRILSSCRNWSWQCWS